jgi:AraC family ethanolamine operon transcriptional activator
MRSPEISKKSADRTWSIVTGSIDGPEDLREVSRGSNIDVVQLKPKKVQGSITHIGMGNIGVSLGRFNSELRMRGALDQRRLVLATILDSAGRVTQWWQDVIPGDVGVFPACVEFDSIHCGGAEYLTVSLDLSELISISGFGDALDDPAFWNTKRLCRPNPGIGESVRRRLKGIISDVEQMSAAPTAQAIDFLQRSIIEAFVISLTSALPQRESSFYSGARLVSETEGYVDAAGGRPVHISELCSALKVSRRSLHRAFADILGVGPVAYLRRRRLSAVRSVLSHSDPATISIGDLAFEYGFPEPSRFAAYYRAHFGEKPSDTSHRCQK